jgi:hypothetical protein
MGLWKTCKDSYHSRQKRKLIFLESPCCSVVVVVASAASASMYSAMVCSMICGE